MWPAKSVTVQLDDRRYDLKYPFTPSMRNVIRDVFERPEYPLCFPDRFVPELIVDVGANVGAASLWFRHHYPEARIIAFEPSPSVFDYLKGNTRTLDVEVHNVGLFDCQQQVNLHIGQHHAAQSSIVAHDETSESTEQIDLVQASTQLDELGADRISILKLDTEGCEVPILRNIANRLDNIDAIYLEYHSEDDRRELDQLLAEHFVLLRARVDRSDRGTMLFLSRNLYS